MTEIQQPCRPHQRNMRDAPGNPFPDIATLIRATLAAQSARRS